MAAAEVGHNNPPVAASALKSIVERIENLDAEKSEIAEQIKEVFAEAKGNGYAVGPIRKLVALRKKDSARVREDKALLELYAEALGCADLV